MKHGQLIKLLTQHGWRLSRHGGRHDLYSHPDFEKPIAVPRHTDEVLKGLTHKILKQAGIK